MVNVSTKAVLLITLAELVSAESGTMYKLRESEHCW